MEPAAVSAEFLTAANALTGFAVLQNVAFCYSMVRREMHVRLEGRYRWIVLLVAILWIPIYIVGIVWCSEKAAAVNPSDPLLAEALRSLMWAKCIAVGFVGACSCWFIYTYETKAYWKAPGRPV